MWILKNSSVLVFKCKITRLEVRNQAEQLINEFDESNKVYLHVEQRYNAIISFTLKSNNRYAYIVRNFVIA